MVKMIILLFILHGKMQMLMQNGLAKDYQLKQNGNLLQEVEKQESCTHGAINLNPMVNGWQIYMRVSFLNMMTAPMGIRGLLPSNSFPQMNMDCLISLEMFGSGAVIGIVLTIIKH